MLTFLAAFAITVPVPWEMKPAGAEPVHHKGLAITVRPLKNVFTSTDQLAFQVEFRNESPGPRLLSLTETAGSETAGRYEYHLRVVEADRTWTVIADPKAPRQFLGAISLVNLQPEKSVSSKVVLPGAGRLFDRPVIGDEPIPTGPRLPAGRYELIIDMKLTTGAVRTNAVRFRVGDK